MSVNVIVASVPSNSEVTSLRWMRLIVVMIIMRMVVMTVIMMVDVVCMYKVNVGEDECRYPNINMRAHVNVSPPQYRP